ncbi:hypothetical protein DXG01_009197, partial [Tephrocybe rancida]
MALARALLLKPCPMECSMSTAEKTWSCRISLRISYGADGTLNASTHTQQFGPIITDKKDVELWIRRAQAAILNPSIPESEYLEKTEKDLKQGTRALQFSKNVVCVHVSDPELTDLSFIDLPVAITTSLDDMQNQAAVRLARDADPTGGRTIGAPMLFNFNVMLKFRTGVLTKPDGLSDGATGHLQSWKDVIEGKLHPLKHGYYCVRLPNDAERNRSKSRSNFQKFAASFFDTTTPWSTIADRNRFGIPNFVASIS